MKIQNSISTDGFPELVQQKGGLAKIYRAKNRDRYRFEVRYHDPEGLLQRETFDEYTTAKKHANAIVKQLASGGLTFLPLRGKERFIYERALDLLAPTGLALVLPNSSQFKSAFLHRRRVAIEADGELERRFVLRGDDLHESDLMRVARGLVAGEDALQLAHEPMNDRATAEQQEAQRGQEEPAVSHRRGVIHHAQEVACVHVGHGHTRCRRTAPARLRSEPYLQSRFCATIGITGRLSRLL